MLNFSDVPLVDSTATKALEAFAHKPQRAGTRLYSAGAGKGVRRTLLVAGLRKPLVRYSSSAEDAVKHWRSASAEQAEVSA